MGKNRRVVTGVLKARNGVFEGTLHKLYRYRDGKPDAVLVLDIEHGEGTVYHWL